MGDFDDDFNDERAKAAFDQTMLKTLLVEFLREANIPFIVVNNSRFRAIFRFICPRIVLPSHQDLIKLNATNYDLFKTWETWKNSDYLSGERCYMVEKWAREDLKNGNFQKPPRNEKSLEELLKIDRNTLTSSIPGFQGDDTSRLWTFSEGAALLDSKQSKRTVSYEEPPKPEILDVPGPSEEKEIKMEEPTQDLEIKPTLEELEMIFDEPKHSPREKIRNKLNLISVKDVPGYVKWPCIVCTEVREANKVRAVVNADAFFMIFICLMTGQYGLDKAKELARMMKFRCCVDHLADMYDNAKNYLNIIDPDLDICPENEKVVEAFFALKEIKEDRYTGKPVVRPIGRKNIVPFVNSLKKFFATYERKNSKGPLRIQPTLRNNF